MSQSQISQFSDNYPSSVLEDAPLDHLPLLPSDSAHSFNPDVLYGQTSASTPDLTFVRSPFAAPPPDILQRVGLSRKQIYVLWTDMVNDEFVAWWLKTEYGSRMNRNIFEGKRQAECWQHFHQVAAIQDGTPKVMCKTCDHTLNHPANGHRGTSSMNKHYSQGINCRRMTPQSKDIRKLIQRGAHLSSQKTAFSHEAWIERIITFITSLQLPFQLVEHPQFRALIEMARLAPSLPEIPSSDTVRRRLHQLVLERQQRLLQKLPTGSKLSIALDCWTSPFRQAFMAVTGYFIDQDWNYREILLGFEPLHGTHTGINLGTVLFQLLQKHQIEGRVLTVTTDNASNNSTLVESIKDSLQALELPNQTPIIRIPCIAHVIQLSLKELLGQMDVNPKNDREEMEFTGEKSGSRRENQEIIITLNKIRKLAVHINKSPQRRDRFLELQSKEPRLVPIQDVRTRWNSTFLMLRRAKRLQSIFDEFCQEYNLQDMQLSQDEWRQVDYLLSITQPFFIFTNVVSKSKDITIHTVFGIYNALFSHIEKSKRRLYPKKVPWKTVILKALSYAKDKLSEYYGATDTIDDDLYAIGTIMAPQNKLEFFQTSEWGPKWHVRYRKSLEKYLMPYEKRYSDIQPTSHGSPSAAQVSDLEMLISKATPVQSQTNANDELRRYIGSGTRLVNPRVFWKDHQDEFPILASLARDVLSTPATGSGVERLFNSARDICHYRRGSLKPKTIRDLMMYMCTTQFDVESDQLTFIEEYLSTQEIHAAREKEDAEKKKEEFDLISDGEDNTPNTISRHPGSQRPSERTLGKRPRREATPPPHPRGVLIQLDNEDDIPLPDNSMHGESSTQRRTSGRVSKRARRDQDIFEYQKP